MTDFKVGDEVEWTDGVTGKTYRVNVLDVHVGHLTLTSDLDPLTIPRERVRLAQPLPAESASEVELVVGEEYEGVGHNSGVTRCGRLLSWTNSTAAIKALDVSEPLHVLRSTLRRISSPPKPTEARKPATCPRCGSMALNIHDDKCDGCGITGQELRVLRERDPYREPVSKKMTDAQYAEWSKKQDERHRAALEAHRKDLDRGQAERRRNVRHWAESWATSSYESDH